MAAIPSVARKILGRALAQRPLGVEVAQPQRLLPRMLPHGGLLGRSQPPLIGSSCPFSTGGHKTNEGLPNKDFSSGATTNKLRKELEKKQVEMLLVLRKMDFVSGAPIYELEKKNGELIQVVNKIIKSKKPEELRDLITQMFQATGAQQGRSHGEFGKELLLAVLSTVFVAMLLVTVDATRKVRRLKMCLVAVAGIHVLVGTYYLMSRLTPAQLVHGGDIGGGKDGTEKEAAR